MIISQTIYRVSFAGGGTDLPAFYRHESGAVGISNDRVNGWYEAARRAGAAGGKLLGAGGGGFLLLVAPPWRHRAIREALGRPHELPFRIARHGSRNVFIQN